MGAVPRRCQARGGEPVLKRVEPRQEPPVLPQHAEKEEPLHGHQRQHYRSAHDDQQLGSRESAEPGDHARAHLTFQPLPDHKGGYSGEHPVACERRPARRGGVDLAEAVAVGLAAARQVGADTGNEEEQEYQSTYGAPDGCGGGDQGGGHGKLGQRQQDAQWSGESARHPEVGDRPARALAVGELGDPGHDEDCGEQQPREENDYGHSGSPNVFVTPTKRISRLSQL
jgi:hypothetical protein